MANLRGTVRGYNKNGGSTASPASRLGHESLETHAGTWKTFADVVLLKDGSGSVTIRRGAALIYNETWGPE